MSIKDEIIEIREAVEKFAKSHDMSIDEAYRYLLTEDIDIRDIPQAKELEVKLQL